MRVEDGLIDHHLQLFSDHQCFFFNITLLGGLPPTLLSFPSKNYELLQKKYPRSNVVAFFQLDTLK